MSHATHGHVNGHNGSQATTGNAFLFASSSAQEAQRHRRVAEAPIGTALFFVDAAREVGRARERFAGRAHLVAALGEEVGELIAEVLAGASPGRRGAEAMQVAGLACRVATENDADFEGKPPLRFQLLAEMYVALGEVARGLIEKSPAVRVWGELTKLVGLAEQLGEASDEALSPKSGAEVLARIEGRVEVAAKPVALEFSLLPDDVDPDGDHA